MSGNSTLKGFTIIELLIVVSIIAVLATVAVRPMLSAKAGAKENAALQVIRSLEKAETTYFTRHRTYANLDALVDFGVSPVGEGDLEASSEYTFSSSSDDIGYTIVAEPPQTSMRTYTLFDTGELLGE